MRLKTLVLTAALTLMLIPTLASAAPATWTADTAHSEIGFSVRHFFSPVSGRFNDFSGAIVFDPENVGASSVEFTVEAASIDTANEQRDGHLRSPDFFDVEKFPNLSFKSTKVAGTAPNLSVTGDLTMHGVTKEVTLDVTFLGAGETPMGTKAGFSTEFTVDRKDYGISWNRVMDTGGAILGDEVTVRINVEANKKEAEKKDM